MVSNRQKNSPPDESADILPLIKGRRATSYDVARLAGVSQSAVSRCFKDGASVSQKMRELVMKAAEELEYQPNAIARGLITQRSNLVAVLVSGRLNLYYPEVLFRLTEELSKVGLRVLLFTLDSEEEAETVIEQAWRFQVDGVISASHLSRSQFDVLDKRGIPVVFFNRYFVDRPTNVVYCDPTSQAHALIKKLVDFGHRDFGLIRGPSANMVSQERSRIVREALKRHGISNIREATGDFTYESGGAALQELYGEGINRPTAIISVNDMMALGCMDEARAVLELKVPDDLSVAGFDGTGVSQFASYELTTIRQPIGRMSHAAVNMIAARVESPDQSNEKRVFEGALIEGGSIAKAP
ncbi:LacI family DNA-binding transcriptional regulator [Hyphomonas sp.]|uniref:LacI family DNA-binding transcriptional regulator n=1 Tax=Hyphomonas sp. TaxID=87 RepID=UPI00356B3D5F